MIIYGFVERPWIKPGIFTSFPVLSTERSEQHCLATHSGLGVKPCEATRQTQLVPGALPIAAVVFPAASRASVRRRTSGSKRAISLGRNASKCTNETSRNATNATLTHWRSKVWLSFSNAARVVADRAKAIDGQTAAQGCQHAQGSQRNSVPLQHQQCSVKPKHLHILFQVVIPTGTQFRQGHSLLVGNVRMFNHAPCLL